MEFAENNTETYIPHKRSFIYFLLDGNEVIYVGQTKRGLIRPLSHTDKVFDRVEILYCEEKYLDITEDKYITKYLPIHNKTMNTAYGMMQARNHIRKMFNPSYSKTDLKRHIKELNIQPILLNSAVYISHEDFTKIIAHIEKERAINNVSI